MKFSNFKTCEEIKIYLDKPFWYTTKSVFHYTSLDSLVKIFDEKRLKFSKFESTNDILEEKIVTEETKKKNFFSLMKTQIDNYGMWAMYGGLTKSDYKSLKDVCVKIEFPVSTLKKYISDKNLNANLIAYTNLIKPKRKNIITCGTVKNKIITEIKKDILSGYLKDDIWKNEEELRLWSVNEYENIDDEFLASLKLIPSPCYTADEYVDILKKSGINDDLIKKMHFIENKYYNTYRKRP